MELLDLYDDLGNPTGEVIKRGEKINSGNVMLSIVFIKNSKNEYLIQKTSEEKDSVYSSTGGHVTHNENGMNTIVRELKEELGVAVEKEEVKEIALVKIPTRSCVVNLYLLEKDISIDDIVLQTDEVESVCWMDKDEILKLIEEEKFLKSHGYLFKNYIVK